MFTKWKSIGNVAQTHLGRATVFFQEPDGNVSGVATVTVQPDGDVEIAIEIKEFSIPPEYHGFLMPFLRGDVPKVNGSRTTFHDGRDQAISRLDVTTESGVFRASRAFIAKSRVQMFGEQDSTITVVANDLEYSPVETQPEDYWCLPLCGALDEFRNLGTACSITDRAPYFAFTDNRSPYGLEILGDRGRDEISAIAFGEIGALPHATVEEVLGLLPSGLLSALSFAAGSDISSPYLEICSFEGKLARRLHLRLGSARQNDGFPAFTKFDCMQPGTGLGRFLHLFFALSNRQRNSLVPPINLIRSGAPGGASVDENIADMVKALDALCKLHGLARQNLSGSLEPPHALAVATILQDAREKLKRIRRQAKEQGAADQVAILDKIIARQANVATEERDFGIAVTNLLEHHGLADAEAMNAYYLQHGDTTWQQILSAIRGQVIHSGAIHISDRSLLYTWFDFGRHLHDVCKRVILKEVGYDGTYAASNVRYTGQYRINRVTPSTSVGNLGYDAVPVSL